MSLEKVRVATIRPKDILCDAAGNVIGTVISTAHPSPMDYAKSSEMSVAYPDGGRQDFDLPSGIQIWRVGVSGGSGVAETTQGEPT